MRRVHGFWAGAVPRSWSPFRIRDTFRLINGFPFPSSEFNSCGHGRPLIRIRDILSGKPSTFFSGQDGLNVTGENGDIVIGMDGDFNVVWWQGGSVLLNQRICALRARRDIDPKFAFYQLPLSLGIINALTPSSTVKHLSSLDVLGLRVFAPELPTQKRIADFLDRQTSRIDELIEKKQRLVELLEERVFSLIDRKVFPLGHPGDTSETGLPRLRYLVEVGPVRSGLNQLPGDTETVFAPMQALADGLGGLDASRVRPLNEVRSRSYNYFSEGDLLLAKVTPCFENGKKAIAEGLPSEMGFATSEVYVIRIRPWAPVDRHYLNYVFCSSSFRAMAMASMTGASGLRRVAEEAILNFPLPVLELESQRRIVESLDRESRRTDSLRNKTNESIERLRELRSALITAAVTGQIDVDEWERRGGTERELERLQEEGEQAEVNQG